MSCTWWLAQATDYSADAHADVIGDQSEAATQNAWFRCTLCAAISGKISILIQTGTESWGRFPVPRICRWESTKIHAGKHCHSCFTLENTAMADVNL